MVANGRPAIPRTTFLKGPAASSQACAAFEKDSLMPRIFPTPRVRAAGNSRLRFAIVVFLSLLIVGIAVWVSSPGQADPDTGASFGKGLKPGQGSSVASSEADTPAEKNAVDAQIAIAEAREYFAEHLEELRALVLEQRPRLIAERNAVVLNLEAASAYMDERRAKLSARFKELRLGLKEENAKLSPEDRKEKMERTRDSNRTRNVLAFGITYLRACSSDQSIGTTTLGAMAAELLNNQGYYMSVGKPIADVARSVLNHPQMAERFESVQTGEQLVSLLKEHLPTLEGAYKRMLEELSDEAEMRAWQVESDYVNGIGQIVEFHNRQFGTDLKAIDGESKHLQRVMRKYFDRIPNSSPEKAEFAQQFSDVLIEIHQREGKTPRAPQ